MNLSPYRLGLWINDVQETLFQRIERSSLILNKILLMLAASELFQLHLLVTEQYPKGLGPTLAQIQEKLPKGQLIFQKTTFSGLKDAAIREAVAKQSCQEWILLGIETHICVLQAAKDLLQADYRVTLLSDATGSRSLDDYAIAIQELRSLGVRITSTESFIYELLEDSSKPQFRKLLSLIKAYG
jgi:nicotinamidase-related amidase